MNRFEYLRGPAGMAFYTLMISAGFAVFLWPSYASSMIDADQFCDALSIAFAVLATGWGAAGVWAFMAFLLRDKDRS